jgi:hypothetical protein
MNTDDTLLQRLLAQGEDLSTHVREAFLARGAEAVPLLVRVLEDERLILTTAPGEGYAPIHAASLLAELGGPHAIRAMVHALARSEPGELLFDVLLEGLEKLGPAVAPVALEALETTESTDGRLGLLTALTDSGVKDERIFQHLLKHLETEPDSAAMKLADYGDARALEPLQRAFERVARDPEEDELLAGMGLIAIEAAIRVLGGTLSEGQKAQVKQAAARGRDFALSLRPQPARRPERPGRNEPCWCGSGVKYKKCHAASDRG